MGKMRKIMYIVIGIFILLAILLWSGKKSVSTDIVINANAQKVWQVLFDFEKYSQWNTVLKLTKGKVEVGSDVVYKFTQDEQKSYDVSAKVVNIIPNKLLNQYGGMPFILTYNHRYILEPLDDKTRVSIKEDYRGIGVNFWNPKEVKKAYARLNLALKKRVESIK